MSEVSQVPATCERARSPVHREPFFLNEELHRSVLGKYRQQSNIMVQRNETITQNSNTRIRACTGTKPDDGRLIKNLLQDVLEGSNSKPSITSVRRSRGHLISVANCDVTDRDSSPASVNLPQVP